ECGFRWVRARHKPYEIAGLADAGEASIHGLAPDRIVDRARLHTIERGVDPLVLVRIERLVGLYIVVALAVAVGVDDDRRPALRLPLAPGLLVHLRVEPAYDAALRPALAEPECAVGVMAEIEVMGRKAGIDRHPLAGLRIVH